MKKRIRNNNFSTIQLLLPKGAVISFRHRDWFTVDFSKNTKIYIGRNRLGNQSILNHCIPNLSKDYIHYWFHLKDSSSAHTILEYDLLNEEKSEDLYNSMKWIYNKVYNNLEDTIYCKLEDIKTTKTPGLVNYKNEYYCKNIDFSRKN
jgi:predicted ribosome quality control (RQC) complex YloA/Tae2 family protein